MMTGARGEATIQDGEREIRLLYTNRALANAERALGKSVIAASQASGVYDMVQLLLAGMEAARQESRVSGRAYTLSDAYKVMDGVGFVKVTNTVNEALAAVLSYGTETREEEAEDRGGAVPNA